MRSSSNSKKKVACNPARQLFKSLFNGRKIIGWVKVLSLKIGRGEVPSSIKINGN